MTFDPEWLRTLSGLVPADDEAQSELRRIPVGERVRAKITRPRNSAQLRYYYAMCQLVSINHRDLQTKEQVDMMLRLLTHYDVITNERTGESWRLPKRLAFSKLDQAQWEQFLARAKDAVLRELLPGVANSDLEKEIAQMASR